MEEGPMKKKAKTLQARSYQVDVLNRALKENLIVYLETGTGKTHIAVMLIKSVEEKLSLPDSKRIAVFLAPTVQLVIQQAGVVSAHTELKVGVYYGDVGVDTWNVEKWQEEIDAHQVLVMTPQVFLNALNTSAITLKIVELLIMDECHHAQKNHPYALIMRTHYHGPGLKTKPKIFGMTASPVIKKGVSSITDCVFQIQSLENILDAKLYTVEDRKEVEQFSPTPSEEVEYYHTSAHDFFHVKSRIDQLKDELTISTVPPQLKRKITKSIDRLCNAVFYCLTELGLLPAFVAVEILMNEKNTRSDLSPEEQEVRKNYKVRFLHMVSSVFSDSLSQVPLTTLEDMTKAERKGVITSKVLLLLNLLVRYRKAEYMRCIVFVDRVIVSLVLAKLISGLHFLSHVHCDYMSGTNHWCARNHIQQQRVLDDFSDGKLNLLIATSVAEEGLDVQECSAVVRFDLCQTMRSHVQSRGRARRPASRYIWLLERGNMDQEKLLLHLIGSENLTKEQVIIRTTIDISREAPAQGDLEIFRVESGACKSTEDSVSFIYQYCARLPGDRYYLPRPTFTTKNVAHLFVCVVQLPPNAPLHLVEGPPRRTEEIAKKVACLEACKQLLEIGAVRRETLCPDIKFLDEEEQEMPKDPAGKPLEFVSSAKPVVFRASWIRNSGAQLQMYKISFAVEPQSQPYAQLALLMESTLDEELANFEMVLYSQKFVKAKLCHLGQTQLGADQVNAAKAYHELLFNGAYKRLDSSVCGSGHWDESHGYLLLPVTDEGNAVDWGSVFSAAEAFKKLSAGSTSLSTECDAVTCSRTLHTAGGDVPVSALLDSVVVAVHSKALYCVAGVIEDSTAESKLSGSGLTYVEYFRNKYDKHLCLPMQPLLRVKQTRAFTNLLVKGRTQDENEGDKQHFEELPPELCLWIGLNSAVLRSFYLIPSFMHRLTSLISACQLRATILSRCPWIPVSKILEALTSKKCQECFSLKSLALLGDSFLKYSVTRRLFLVYRDKHEGQLSARRSRATCNATLNKLAKSIGLSDYIQDGFFNPSRWVAPGMYVPLDLSCQCDINKLISYDKLDAETKCGDGHRYIRWKVLADVVEALIGAFVANGGPEFAEEVMSLMGIEVRFDAQLITEIRHRSLPPEFQVSVESLEQKLHYSFRNKSLLVEAITHASKPDACVCYQRLEFLGDSVLDLLVTRHLFETHPGLRPGVLTDLRSSAVNNTCFARVTVKHGLHLHLRYDSEELERQIREFVEALKGCQGESSFGFEGPSGPKVLADVLESIAGAVYLDTGYDLDQSWSVLQPLLAPIVTPDTLPIQPVRELRELCEKLCEKCDFLLDEVRKIRTVKVSVRELEFTAESLRKANKKEAEKDAASNMLKILRESGFTRTVSEVLINTKPAGTETQSSLKLGSISGFKSDINMTPFLHELCTEVRQEPAQTVQEIPNRAISGHGDANSSTERNRRLQDEAEGSELPKLPATILSQIDHPGGSTAFMYELCLKRQWGRPNFQFNATGASHLRMFSSSVAVVVSNQAKLEETSCYMFDKKKARDDASRKLILRLVNMGILK